MSYISEEDKERIRRVTPVLRDQGSYINYQQQLLEQGNQKEEDKLARYDPMAKLKAEADRFTAYQKDSKPHIIEKNCVCGKKAWYINDKPGQELSYNDSLEKEIHTCENTLPKIFSYLIKRIDELENKRRYYGVR